MRTGCSIPWLLVPEGTAVAKRLPLYLTDVESLGGRKTNVPTCTGYFAGAYFFFLFGNQGTGGGPMQAGTHAHLTSLHKQSIAFIVGPALTAH